MAKFYVDAMEEFTAWVVTSPTGELQSNDSTVTSALYEPPKDQYYSAVSLGLDLEYWIQQTSHEMIGPIT